VGVAAPLGRRLEHPDDEGELLLAAAQVELVDLGAAALERSVRPILESFVSACRWPTPLSPAAKGTVLEPGATTGISSPPNPVREDAMEPSERFETARLADQLERSFRGGAWHGPAVAEALDGVGAAAAARRPLVGAHTIAEIVGHLTYWLRAAVVRLRGEREEEVLGRADWPPAATAEDAWRAARAALEAAHRELHAAVVALEDSRLDDPVPGSDPTVRGMLLGLLQHNAYHAGQIALLAKAAGGGA
jgi:uncharacterized damage-inducible protein DinB